MLAAQNAVDAPWLARWPIGRDVLSRVLVSSAALAGAVALLQLNGWLVWDRLVPRYSGLRIPGLLRQFVGVLVMVATFVAVLSQVWGVALPAVLATTGVFGLVLGLALRGTLTDFFSGIALNIEQPFRLDDFVLLHTRLRREPIAGLVREINWRSTRILTPEDNLVSVPNRVVATAVVENLSFPSPVSEQEVDIALDWTLPQGVTDALLGAAVTEAWMRGAVAGDKPPKVRICRLDGYGVTWRITYLLDPRLKAKGPARHELLSCVHRHLVLAGVRPVALADNGPRAGPASAETPVIGKVPEFDTPQARRRVLDTMPLLDSLTNVERETLATAMRLRQVDRGGRVVERGQAGRSMSCWPRAWPKCTWPTTPVTRTAPRCSGQETASARCRCSPVPSAAPTWWRCGRWYCSRSIPKCWHRCSGRGRRWPKRCRARLPSTRRPTHGCATRPTCPRPAPCRGRRRSRQRFAPSSGSESMRGAARASGKLRS